MRVYSEAYTAILLRIWAGQTTATAVRAMLKQGYTLRQIARGLMIAAI